MKTKRTDKKTMKKKPANETAMPKPLYHSALVREAKPIPITVLSEAKKSGDPKNPVEYVEVAFKKEARAYILDRPQLAAFFEGQVGRSMFVLAEGSKGAEILTYLGEAVAEDMPKGTKLKKKPSAPPPERTPDPVQTPAPTHHQPEMQTREDDALDTREKQKRDYQTAIHDMKIYVGRHTVLAAIATDAAEVVAARHERKYGKPMSEERVAGLAMRFMIACDRMVGKLPSNLVDFLPVDKKD